MGAAQKLAYLEEEMIARMSAYADRKAGVEEAMRTQPGHMREFYLHEALKMQGRIEELDHLLRFLGGLT